MNTSRFAALLGLNSGKWRAACATLSPFSKPKVPRTSQRNWHSAGRSNPRKLSLTHGLGVWVWSGASPHGTVRRNLGQRSQLPAFFLTGINARRPTSIATKRSRACFAEPHNFHRRKDFGPPPTLLSSALSQLLECG